jgi:hypothetical protein
MNNLKIFGSPIHDTALVFIVSSTVASIVFNYFSEISRADSLLILAFGAVVSALYYYKEYSK